MPTPPLFGATLSWFRSQPWRQARFPGLLSLLLLAGCSSPAVPTAESAPAKTAHLVMINLCDHEWLITISSTGDVPASTSRVPVHGTLRMELAAGKYTFDQKMLTAPGEKEHARHFAARFENNRTYEWPLAALEAVVLPPGAMPP